MVQPVFPGNIVGSVPPHQIPHYDVSGHLPPRHMTPYHAAVSSAASPTDIKTAWMLHMEEVIRRNPLGASPSSHMPSGNLSSARLHGMSHEDAWSTATILPSDDICGCGTTFLVDCMFCRNCGAKRPQSGEAIDLKVGDRVRALPGKHFKDNDMHYHSECDVGTVTNIFEEDGESRILVMWDSTGRHTSMSKKNWHQWWWKCEPKVVDRANGRGKVLYSPPRSPSIGRRLWDMRSDQQYHAISLAPELQGKSFATSWLRDGNVGFVDQQVSELSLLPSEDLTYPPRRQDDVKPTLEAERQQAKRKYHLGSLHYFQDEQTSHARHHHSSSYRAKDERNSHDMQHHHHRRNSHGRDGSKSHNSTSKSRLRHSRGSGSPVLLIPPADSRDSDINSTFKPHGSLSLSLEMLAAGLWHEMEKERELSAKAAHGLLFTSPPPSQRRNHNADTIAIKENETNHEASPKPFWEK